MEIMGNLVIIIGLGINALLDIRRRQVSAAVVMAMALLGLGCRMIAGDIEIVNMLTGLIPAGIAVLWTLMARGSIGKGDIWMLAGMGPVLGGIEMAGLCLIALFMAGICGMVMVVFFHKGRKDELPFVPFLLLGKISMMIGGI